MHCWIKVSWTEYINEVLITKPNDQCLSGQTHHVVNEEELSLQMAKEILSLPIIPSVIVQFNGLFILRYWLQFTKFGNNQEYNTTFHPVEEEYDLIKQPCSDVINVCIPHTKMLLDGENDVEEQENRECDTN